MADLTTELPRCSPDLIICPSGVEGEYVVKNPRNQTYLKVGEIEAFLLRQLDGRATVEQVSEAFAARFGEPLSADDIREFIAVADEQGLLHAAKSKADQAEQSRGVLARFTRAWRWFKNQNPLYFRVRLINPDAFLSWLEPKTRVFWSREAALVTALLVLWASAQIWVDRDQFVSEFTAGLQIETVIIVWFTMVAITFVHEFAHGLACKRYGGEVPEIGVMFMFLTPFFYCNVSDAWLLQKRSQRLLVSFAGTYVDLQIWALMVLLWRITIQDSLINHLAWVVVSTCGARIVFNLNPLMKLDGYYALADLLEVSNLRRRAIDLFMQHCRWLLWGAAPPARQERGTILLVYGGCCWLFSVAFLHLMFWSLYRLVGVPLGVLGVFVAGGLFVKMARQLFVGISNGEVTKMILKRHWRTVGWSTVVLAAVCFPMRDRKAGTFQLRPLQRVELRAPVAGFLRTVNYDEGDRIPAGTTVATFEIPELLSQITRKEAEIRESQANLRRLESGSRPEVIAEQRERVQRATVWREMAAADLKRAQLSLKEELSALDFRIDRSRSQLDYLTSFCSQAEALYNKGGLAGVELAAERQRRDLAVHEVKQLEANRRSREAEGVLRYEAELASREKDLADTVSALKLLEAGSRPEDVEAERARVARFSEELTFLHETQSKLTVACPVEAVVVTPRVKEKVGLYLEKGTPICVLENISVLEAEISFYEQDANSLKTGASVSLKPRSQPHLTLSGKVDRIAPAATNEHHAVQSKLIAYCRLNNSEGVLRSGMTGAGRIECNIRPIGLILFDKAMRYVRTEFWW